MTQVWQGDKVVPVTRVLAGPCQITGIRTMEKDKYEGVRLGFGVRAEKKLKKPEKAELKGLKPCRFQKEVRVQPGELKRGDIITVATFMAGDIVKVTGTSKGKGYQGVVKRHHFSGASKTHGTKDQVRMPGSSGATAPQHVFKGTRKPGHMGNARVTTSNLEIIDIDAEKNLLYIKGAVPGARHSLLLIQGAGELIAESKIQSTEIDKKSDEITPAAVNI